MLSIAIAAVLAQGAPASETVEIPGTTLTFDLVPVPGGKLGDRDLRPFWMATAEVTWGQYDTFFEGKDLEDVDTMTRPTKAKSYLGQAGLPPVFMEAQRPVTNVRWHGAVAYCEWLSRKTGAWFRLPTEAEWELAARAGEAGEKPGDLDGAAWHKGNSTAKTNPGGGRKANALGLHDMLGNVWEYCLEPADLKETWPVVRGGAWNVESAELAFSLRKAIPRKWFDDDPNRPRSTWWLTGDYSQGFRVVRACDASDAKERAEAAAKVKVEIAGGAEQLIKIEGAAMFFNRLKGKITNGAGKALDEVEVMVWSATPEGKPHLIDIKGADKPGRATWGKVYPVLVNAHHAGSVRTPLGPGESREFTVDIPYSFDEEPDVDPTAFGGRVTNLRFSGR